MCLPLMALALLSLPYHWRVYSTRTLFPNEYVSGVGSSCIFLKWQLGITNKANSCLPEKTCYLKAGRRIRAPGSSYIACSSAGQ